MFKSKKYSNILNYLLLIIFSMALIFAFIPFNSPSGIDAALTSWTSYLSSHGLTNTAYAGGAGSSSNPYLISSPLQLAKLAYDTNRGISTNNKYYKLINNVDVSSYNGTSLEWTPIGSTSYHFNGNFNGNGYSVNGINIDNTSTSAQGLFGYASGATIKNLTVGSGSINCSGYCGAVIGYASGCVINNCINDAVNVSSVGGGSVYVGGIIGISYSSTIDHCFNYASVKCTINSAFSYGYAGGIIGYNSVNTEYCMNYGDITSTANTNLDGITNYAGGIAGYSNKASYSGNLGAISSGHSSYSQTSYAGGVSGNAGGDISYCFNRGNVTANTKEVSSTTTLSVPSSETLWSNTTTTQTGLLNGFSTNTFNSRIEYKTKSAFAGGIVGYSAYNASNCYNAGTISGGLRKATLYYYYSYAYGVSHGGNNAAGMVPDTTGIVVRTKLEYIDKYHYAGINGNTEEGTSYAYSVNPTYDTTFKMTVEDSKTYHRGSPSYSESLGNAQSKTTTGNYTFGNYNFSGSIKVSNGLRTIINLNSNNIAISITYKWTDGKNDSGERSKDLYSLSWDNSRDNYTSKTSSALKSLSSMSLSNSVWTTNSLINDGYPYIKELYWKDNSSGF